MLNKKEILYSLDDVAIMPSPFSYVTHRKECNVYNDDFMLPIFTAPMPTVVNMENYQNYISNNIYPIIPRTETIGDRLKLCFSHWVSFSLSEFIEHFVDNVISEYTQNKKMYVLIDIANGNMLHMFSNVKKAKSFYGTDICIMIGNIANPETYEFACKYGVDYARISVGTGYGCTTATNLGIYYPMASLIDKCYNLSKPYSKPTKIIADGGIHNYRDMIKCLALGADYVMLGKMFAELNDINPQNDTYYGMASNEGKEKLNNNNEYPPEGRKVNMQKVNKSLKEFVFEFTGYLKSAMSYCNKTTLEEFIGKVTLNIISENSSKSFNQ